MSQSYTEFSQELPSTQSIPDSEYHRLLSSERRRLLLDVLDEQSTVVDLETAAEALAEREAGDGKVASDSIDEIAITLHHTHLPMLADAGVLEYDTASHVIET